MVLLLKHKRLRGNPNELNKERLWRKFQNLTSSDDFCSNFYHKLT